MNYLNTFLFGYYPYVCLVVFLLGSLIRFDRDQYTWKSDSSQLLRRAQLRWGSNLFHIGILGIFFGHLFGLLTPLAIWHALGVSAQAKQMLAIVAGGIFGAVMLVGLLLLIHRRMTEPRVRSGMAMNWLKSSKTHCGRSAFSVSTIALSTSAMSCPVEIRLTAQRMLR